VVQLGLGVLAVAVAVALRMAVDSFAPGGVTPYALVYPAILLATGLAGWRAGAAGLVTGCGVSLWLSPAIGPAQLFSMGLYILSAVLVIAAAAAYRATALALRDSQDRLDLATAAAKVGVWERRFDTDDVFLSDEARRICGLPLAGRVTFAMIARVTHPDDRLRARAQFDRARDPGVRDDRPFEYRIVRPTGEVRWVHARGRMLFAPGRDGRLAPSSYVGTMQDVTARKADEERLQLLAREVDHRANNLLAVVQGTVSLSEAEDPAALKSVITGRVNALARAHQLLAQARWEGADLRRLVEEELLAFSLGDEHRVAVRGAPTALPPAAAQSVAMALHELATNAAKYGALSAPGGRVEVTWKRDYDGALAITWREAGGPRVVKPTRKGLGTTVLGRALAGPIRGRTTLDWRPEGLVCQLFLPRAALEPAAPESQAEETAEAEPEARSAR
jgi:PAS domain S-box-containing protein